MNSGFLGRPTSNNVIIGRAINDWQNNRGAVSVPKDSIQTRVVAFDTAKHFIIPIETLFYLFLLIRQHKLRNDAHSAQLRIATVTRFSW